MSKTVGDIAINVTADIGPLVREMSRAKSAVSGFQGVADGLAGGLNSIGSTASNLGAKLSIVTAAMAAAAAGALALTKNAADAGDHIAKTARQAGVSAQYYQEMEYAIRQVSNLTQEEFDKALTTLNRRLGEAEAGSAGAVAAFEAIGISAADVASGAVTTEQAMNALVATVSDATNPAIAAAVATDLLGKAGAKLGGQLGGASGEIAGLRDRAKELGIVMSAEALQASEQFGDKWDDLGRSFQVLQLQVANELLPVFVNTLIPALQDKVIPAIAEVARQVGDVIEWFGDLPAPVQEAAGIIAAALGVGGPVLVAVGATASAIGALVAATGPIGLLIGAAALITAAWVTWGDDIKAAIGPAIEWITTKFNEFLVVLDSIKTKAGEVGMAITNALTFGAGGDLSGVPNFDRPVDQGGVGSVQRPVDGSDPAANARIIGTETANGLVEGFTGTMSSRQSEIDGAINTVPNRAREILGVQSPSTVFFDIGGFVGQGFADGIASAQGLVADAVNGMGKTAVDGANAATDGILGAMGTLFAGNKKIAAAIAFVSMMQGAAKELEKGTFGIGSMAAVLARGAAIIASIKSASATGGGSSAGVSAAGSAARSTAAPAASAPAAAASPGAVAAAAPAQAQIYNISLIGPTQSTDSVRALFERMNDGLKAGYRLEGIQVNG